MRWHGFRHAGAFVALGLVAWLAGLNGASAAPARASGPVFELFIDGAIGPATADYFHRGLEHAQAKGAQLLVLRMDTPGGLDTSMRAIIKDILASPLPVASFVAPGGARAASAGTYILYASHFAAMAPGTNLGAATPVQIGGSADEGRGRGAARDDQDAASSKEGGAKAAEKNPLPRAPSAPVPSNTLERKQVNDASAYIRGLAQLRGRNADWADRAVREAVSLSDEEALQQKVIDLIAPDVAGLVARLDGRPFTIAGTAQVLNLKEAAIERFDADWRTRSLSWLTNPSIAYIMMLVGIYGLFVEFSNPGMVFPGVVGATCLLLASYAFHLLPVNAAGLALLLLGIAFMVAEGFLPAFGSLGVGGATAFVIGSVMLIDTDVPGYGVPLPLVLGFAVASVVLLIFVLGALLKGRRRPVVSGREQLIGSRGEAIEDVEREGWARVHGELWRVESATPLKSGQAVRVKGMRGLVLQVVPEPDCGH